MFNLRQKIEASPVAQRILHPTAVRTRVHKVPGSLGTFGKSGYLRVAGKAAQKTFTRVIHNPVAQVAGKAIVAGTLVFAADELMDKMGVYDE